MKSSHHTLAFGEHRAKQFQSKLEAINEVHRIIPGLIDFDFAASEDFRYCTASVDINGLPISAISSSASRVRVGARPEPALLFSLTGNLRFGHDGFTAEFLPKKNALFIPSGVLTNFECSNRSLVLMKFDTNRLQDTAQTMLGEAWSDKLAQTFLTLTDISLRSGRFSHDAAFRGLFSMIDSWSEHDELRNLSRLDDLFYRALVMAMLPKVFAQTEESRLIPRVSHRQLDIVREYVTAHLDKPISITDLERIGGLTRKSLNYVFMRVCNMSPMAWVQKQRYLARRARMRRSR